MRALQHYTDLVDIKRVIVNTHAIDPQALTEFFGSLSAEWALDCLKVCGICCCSLHQRSCGVYAFAIFTMDRQRLPEAARSVLPSSLSQHTEVLLASPMPRSCKVAPAGRAPACQ